MRASLCDGSASLDPDRHRDHVIAHVHLSLSLGRMGGRRREALVVGTYRELAAARPDAFRPDLAGSLNNLSNRLGDLGRAEEALAAIQEAVTIRRELAARWPDAYPRAGAVVASCCVV